MKSKKNSQSQRKTKMATESAKLRKLVHKCAKSDKTHCITLGAVFATERPEVEAKKDKLAQTANVFPNHSADAGIFEEEHYNPVPTEGDIALRNLLVVGTTVVTMDTIHKVLAATTENLTHIFGHGSKQLKTNLPRIEAIGKLVKEMQKALKPSFKAYIDKQGKALNLNNKPKTTYEKVTTRVVTV